MAWKKPLGAPAAAGAPAERVPTFTIKTSVKTGSPYATVNFRTSKQGGGMLMIFPSKFEGTFAGLAVNGWKRGMIPVLAEQIDVQGNTLKINLGPMKIEVTAENAAELIEFLQYAESMPRVASTFPPRGQAAAAAPEAPKTRSWKK